MSQNKLIETNESNDHGLPIRNPWSMVDYASRKNGQQNSLPEPLDIRTIDLGLGDSEFGPPRELWGINMKLLLLGKLTNSQQRYPPDKFCERPADLVRERFGLPRKTFVTFHGEGSYGLLSNLIVKLPDVTREQEIGVLGIGPQFPNVKGLTELHGKNIETGEDKFPYCSYQPSLDLHYSQKMEGLIADRMSVNGKRFVYIDNPNNPTGDFASLDSIVELAEATESKRDVLIIDEAYGDTLPDDQSAVQIVNDYQHMIVVRGLAKTVGMAGLRVGYAVMSPQIGEVYKSLELVFGVSGPQQLMLNEILKPQILDRHLRSVGNRVEDLKNPMAEGLQSLGYTVFSTHMRVPIMLVEQPGRDLYAGTYRHRIAVERGSDFAATYPLDDSYARIKIPRNRRDLKEFLYRMQSIAD